MLSSRRLATLIFGRHNCTFRRKSEMQSTRLDIFRYDEKLKLWYHS